MKEQRKLAAIIFTDIVGYSGMMSKDEKLAMSVLLKNRNVQKDAIKKFNGEFIKEIGDGTLSIFQSSWDAVSCAIDIQKIISSEFSFQLRIGIHIGDIIISESDVFGDGVNIASRIQALCEPGGICISQRVYEDIKNKSGIKVDCVGEKLLKNIDQPVSIYAIAAECIQNILVQQRSDEETHSQSGEIKRNAKKVPSVRKLYIGISTAIVTIIILIAGYFLFPKKTALNKSLSNTEGSFKRKAKAIWTNSIAVLPFTDLSPDKDQEYFCDGISEELINVMTQIPELKVVARTSAFSFKGKEIDIRDIGEKLNVKTILEGSVRKSGNQLRISAQLIDVNNGYHLWSQTYNRELKDVFTIQNEIALTIVAALKTNLLLNEKEQIEKKSTENTEAYQLYLKGRFYWNKRTADDIQKAIDYFTQAIEKDSAYAMAYAGLAASYILLPEYAAISSEDIFAKAIIAVKKALELDPTLAEPHAVLGIIKTEYEWDWTGAELEYKKAIELNPNYPTAHHWYNIYLRNFGRLDEAYREVKLALERDPLSPIINVNLGDVLYIMRQYDKAIEQYLKTIELDPDFASAYSPLGVVYALQGKFDNAIAELRKVQTIIRNTPYSLSRLGFAYARSGDKSQALQILDDLFTFREQGYKVAFDIAIVYYGLDDRAKTFEWLEKSLPERDFRLPRMKTEPFWDGIRSDMRFIALLKKMGME